MTNFLKSQKDVEYRRSTDTAIETFLFLGSGLNGIFLPAQKSLAPEDGLWNLGVDTVFRLAH